MISSDEFHQLSVNNEIPLVHVEKDYVMGWVLFALFTQSELSQELILKGGGALRKLYIPATRFTDDLDFTTRRNIEPGRFRTELNTVIRWLAAEAGIEFDTIRTRVTEKRTPDPDVHALDVRIYFKGLAGDSNLTFRVKFDISPFEKIVLPTKERRIIHPFSDVGSCVGNVTAYSIEEILAEKLRTWIQRTRSRDLFDVAKIILSGQVNISKREILSAFMQKTIYKAMPDIGKQELLVREKFDLVESIWAETLICSENAMITAANAISTFTEFVTSLFLTRLSIAGGAGGSIPRSGFDSFIPTSIRERIIQAGKARQLIKLRYSNQDREVEPYSIEYKVRKSDGLGFEYFYGFDRTRNQTIKTFFTHKIQGVDILQQTYQPRFEVEF